MKLPRETELESLKEKRTQSSRTTQGSSRKLLSSVGQGFGLEQSWPY